MQAVSALDVSSAKAHLQVQEAGGGCAYEHLVDLLVAALAQPPGVARARLEATSRSVKAAAAAAAGAAAAGGAACEDSGDAQAAAALAARLRGEAALWRAAAGGGGGAAAAPEPGACAVQDVASEARYLEWAGVRLAGGGFNLALALRALAAAPPAPPRSAAAAGAAAADDDAPPRRLRHLRFWGRLCGREADYLVAEAELEGGDAGGDAVCAYFVCSDVGGAWVRLPAATPAQAVAARRLRRALSGSLTAAVAGHPPFPGDEAAYVSARIALISAGTVLAPAGALTEAAGGVLQPADGWEGADDLARTDAWVHATHELDVQGRRAAGGEGGDEASALLRPISDDAPLVSSAAAATAEGAPAWEVRALPATAGPGDERIAVLRSRRWPGAVTVGFGRRRWANVYFGDGLDLALDAYQLQLPALPPAAVAMRNADGSAVFAEQPDVAEDPEAAARATEAAEAADAAAAAAAAEEVRGSDEAAVAEEAASS